MDHNLDHTNLFRGMLNALPLALMLWAAIIAAFCL